MVFVAGFADAATYTSSYNLFSAHITGNFIVLAQKLVSYSGLSEYFALLTFPVFVVAVYVSGRIHTAFGEKKMSFLVGLLLVLSGVLPLLFFNHSITQKIVEPVVLLLVVFAMGVQNALNKLYPDSVLGMTTVMTGNVTSAVLSYCSAFTARNESHKALFKDTLWMILVFFAGCFAGAYLTLNFSLGVLIIPGALVILYNLFHQTLPHTN